MQSGRSGMGSHKHGISGHATKSPKFRHQQKREAEANERKPRKTKMYNSVKEAFEKEKPK